MNTRFCSRCDREVEVAEGRCWDCCWPLGIPVDKSRAEEPQAVEPPSPVPVSTAVLARESSSSARKYPYDPRVDHPERYTRGFGDTHWVIG